MHCTELSREGNSCQTLHCFSLPTSSFAVILRRNLSCKMVNAGSGTIPALLWVILRCSGSHEWNNVGHCQCNPATSVPHQNYSVRALAWRFKSKLITNSKTIPFPTFIIAIVLLLLSLSLSLSLSPSLVFFSSYY